MPEARGTAHRAVELRALSVNRSHAFDGDVDRADAKMSPTFPSPRVIAA